MFAGAGVPIPIARKTEGDKISRVEGISAMVEAGQLLLPKEAPWRASFKAELLGFPSARFDDQADATAQLLHWVRSKQAWTTTPNAGPIVFWADDDGVIHAEGDEFAVATTWDGGDLDPWA